MRLPKYPKNCRGCNRRKSTCPIPGYKKVCPCRDCIVKTMCVISCDTFEILRAETFKDFLETIKNHEKNNKKDKEVKGISWTKYEIDDHYLYKQHYKLKLKGHI